jgi:hypothetical protein
MMFLIELSVRSEIRNATGQLLIVYKGKLYYAYSM